MPWVKEDQCKGCGICVNVCPVNGAIKMVNGKAQINNAICTRCGKCMEACPTNAIRPNSENPAMRGVGRGGGSGMGRGMGNGTGRGQGRGMGGGQGRGMGRGRSGF